MGRAVGLDASPIRLDDVKDVSVNVGALDPLFGTRTVELRVPGGGRSGVVLTRVTDPWSVAEAIEDARDAAGPGDPERDQPPTSTGEAVTEPASSEHTRHLLRDDEELRWLGKPDKRAFLFRRWVVLPVGFLMLALVVAAPFAGFAAVSEGDPYGVARTPSSGSSWPRPVSSSCPGSRGTSCTGTGSGVSPTTASSRSGGSWAGTPTS